MQTHIINPKTKRMIGVTTKTAIRLAKTGALNEEETKLVLNANKLQQSEPSETLHVIEEKQVQSPVCKPDFKQEPQPVIIQPENSSKTKKIKKELKEIAQENKEKFVGITQEQSDELLKKMLYEKLFVNKPTIDKKKKKKKKKHVVVQSESSDSEESDSEESDW